MLSNKLPSAGGDSICTDDSSAYVIIHEMGGRLLIHSLRKDRLLFAESLCHLDGSKNQRFILYVKML